MKEGILDKEIKNNVQKAKNTKEIQVAAQNILRQDVQQVCAILDQIKQEAQRLSTTKKAKARKRKPPESFLQSIRVAVYYWDERMQKRRWYFPFHLILMGITYPFRSRTPKPKSATSINQLIALPTELFIQQACVLLLKRNPSKKELKANAKALRAGRETRYQLLIRFKHSSEGQLAGGDIPGLEKKYKLYRVRDRVFRTPIIGYILKLIDGLVRLPLYIETIRVNANQSRELQHDVNKMIDEKEEEEERAERKEREEKKQIDLFYDNYNTVIFKDNTRELIKDRYRVYLERIKTYRPQIDPDTANIVDLGSGRGEWLELLLFEDKYKKAIGVDSNEIVVQNANALWLTTILSDAITYLSDMKENSMDVITSFHMVEHLDTIALLKFFEDAYRALKPGGLLIVETPNPENILVATNTFYLDVTHKHPLPPDLLKYIAGNTGFEVKEILRKEPLNYTPIDTVEKGPLADMAYRFNMEQNYAILAVKP